MAKRILPFSQIDKDDINIVGGKGANLGELFKIKAPVPNGFVVTANAYFQFLDETGLKHKISNFLKSVDTNNHAQLDQTSQTIKHVILKEKMSKELESDIKDFYRKLSPTGKMLVAVRSSATAEDLPGASFAGQQATYLNIQGEKQLLKAVQECWASLFEARAIFYRNEKKFDHFRVGIAVVVQEMVESEVSGVMFTIDPMTNDKSKIIIESVWGLGEMIVQGKVTPDHYEVSKKNFEIEKKELGRQTLQLIKTKDKTYEVKVAAHYQAKQKLSDKLIVELAHIGKLIENHYLFPQDLEWAENNGELFIVQTRPVTTITETMKATSPQDSPLKNLKLLLSGASASPGIGTGAVRILKNANEIDKLIKGEVLVTEMTNPDFVPAMRKASAIVTDQGGKTSHAAIVSRELGIPAVVGTLSATKHLKTGMVVTVDGSNGKIYQGGLSTTLNLQLLNKSQTVEGGKKVKTATKVYVNLGEPELAKQVAAKHVDGVGLLRAEFMIAEIGIHPRKLIAEKKQSFFISKLAAGLQTFCAAFGDRPVIYRATDFKTNEYRNLIGGAEFEPNESNPMLGFRGAYRYVSDPQVFEMELEAIKKVRNKLGLTNLWLMIPFVRNVDELKQVKKLVTAAGLHRSNSFKLFMMAEIPANVFLIDEFLDVGIDGISIGSNDLTMLTLGVDRDNQTVASEFSELNPAVLKALEILIKATRKRGLMASICGQAPSIYPQLTHQLVEWGVTSVSVSPDAIESTREIVARAEKELVGKVHSLSGD